MAEELSERAAPLSSAGTDSASRASLSMRKNGKNWHSDRKAFRPTASLTSYTKRRAAEQALAATKAREAEMKAEKKAARDAHIQKIKDRREKKAEKERYEALEMKMHKKKVERLKRREKRNKALKS